MTKFFRVWRPREYPVLRSGTALRLVAKGNKDHHIAHRAGVERSERFGERSLLCLTRIATTFGHKAQNHDLSPQSIEGCAFMRRPYPSEVWCVAGQDRFEGGFLGSHHLIKVLTRMIGKNR